MTKLENSYFDFKIIHTAEVVIKIYGADIRCLQAQPPVAFAGHLPAPLASRRQAVQTQRTDTRVDPQAAVSLNVRLSMLQE